MPKSKKFVKTSFAGANTGKGFISFYDTIFPEEKLDGLYIIKGGSGTGKSTFMRNLGEKAVRRGRTIEHYLCGSDATSLDGIIINGKNGGKVGVIDGTPPHPREFRSPGAAGDILNFGVFWDSRGLREKRKEIDGIAREKSAYFDTAYRYLGAAGKIDSHITDITEKIYLKEKGASAAKRLVHSVGTAGECKYRQLMGYTMNGTVKLKPTDEPVQEFVISGDRDIAKMFLADVVSFIRSCSISAEISLSLLNIRQIDSIYFPESKVWVHMEKGDETAPDKIINMRRFTDREIAAEYRGRLRFGKKCRESLMEGAMESLAGAREKHFALEEMYKGYMDFDSLSSQSELWYSEILSRLD